MFRGEKEKNVQVKPAVWLMHWPVPALWVSRGYRRHRGLKRRLEPFHRLVKWIGLHLVAAIALFPPPPPAPPPAKPPPLALSQSLPSLRRHCHLHRHQSRYLSCHLHAATATRTSTAATICHYRKYAPAVPPPTIATTIIKSSRHNRHYRYLHHRPSDRHHVCQQRRKRQSTHSGSEPQRRQM